MFDEKITLNEEHLSDNLDIERRQRALEIFEGGGDSDGDYGNGQVLIGNLSKLSDCHANLSDFVEKLQERKLEITKIQDRKNGVRSRIKGKDYYLAKSLASITPSLVDGVYVDPEIEVISEINEQCGAFYLFQVNLNHYIDGKKVSDLILEWLEKIRATLASRKFKKIKSNRRSNRKRRFCKMANLIDECYEVRSHVVMCRVDLFYAFGERKQVTFDEFEKDYYRFCNSIRHNKSIYRGLLGAIYKLEFGGEGKGYHCHGYFFYDGRLVYRDDWKAFAIGEFWVNVATKGKGSFFTSNSGKRKRGLAKLLNVSESDLALGRVHRENRRALFQVKAVVWYLSKYAQAVRPANRKKVNAVRIMRTPYLRKLLTERRKRNG